MKSSILDLAEILNIESSTLEYYINLLTSNKEEKLLQGIKQINLLSVDKTLK